MRRPRPSPLACAPESRPRRRKAARCATRRREPQERQRRSPGRTRRAPLSPDNQRYCWSGTSCAAPPDRAFGAAPPPAPASGVGVGAGRCARASERRSHRSGHARRSAWRSRRSLRWTVPTRRPRPTPRSRSRTRWPSACRSPWPRHPICPGPNRATCPGPLRGRAARVQRRALHQLDPGDRQHAQREDHGREPRHHQQAAAGAGTSRSDRGGDGRGRTDRGRAGRGHRRHDLGGPVAGRDEDAGLAGLAARRHRRGGHLGLALDVDHPATRELDLGLDGVAWSCPATAASPR